MVMSPSTVQRPPAAQEPDRADHGWRDPRVPAAVAGPLGFAVTLAVSAALTSGRGVLAPSQDLACMWLAVLALAWCSTVRGAVLCAGIGWLMFNGFVVNSAGTLSWHGEADLLRAGLFLGTALSAAWLRALALWSRSLAD